jgi:2-polyprenyl-3-methyl-5-hydroxy-6-metoxy-1,4-benzoquinol methylase
MAVYHLEARYNRLMVSWNSVLSESGYNLADGSKVWERDDFESITYSDGDEIESRISAAIQNCSDLSSLSDELELHCTDWPSTYHLSKRRGNLIRPFAQSLAGKKILEIGAGMGAITRILGESDAEVIALEGTLRRAKATRSRTRDLPNVTVVADSFEHFQINGKFDVITLIGVLEYANLYSQDPNPHLSMLEKCMELLEPNGSLVIAIENKLGLKYFAGAPEDHVGITMYGIEDHYSRSSVRTFGKIELSDLLKQAGFESSNFATPLPDYKLTTSVITEAGYSFKGFDTASLTRDSFMQDPQLPSWINFSPERALFPIHRNELGLDLANSFLVFANKGENSLFSDSDLAWHYSTRRKKKYCALTKFTGTLGGAILVAKSKLSDNLSSGVLLQNAIPEGNYAQGRLFRDEFEQVFTKINWSRKDFRSLLLDFYGKLMEKRISWSSGSEKSWLSEDSIDLLPHNICRLSNGELFEFDLEWQAKSPVDVRQVIFRSILQFGSISTFERDEFGVAHSLSSLIHLAFELLEIELNDKEAEAFLILEISYQVEIFGTPVELDELKLWIDKPIGKIRSSRLLAERDSAIAERDSAIAERDSAIAERDSAIAERDLVISSTIWRIFSPYRKVRGLFQKS